MLKHTRQENDVSSEDQTKHPACHVLSFGSSLTFKAFYTLFNTAEADSTFVYYF